MKRHYLQFEKPLEALESKINSLQKAHEDHPSLDISRELKSLKDKATNATNEIYQNLTPWQISQVSRHPQRPYSLDYIKYYNGNFKTLNEARKQRDIFRLSGLYDAFIVAYGKK